MPTACLLGKQIFFFMKMKVDLLFLAEQLVLLIIVRFRRSGQERVKSFAFVLIYFNLFAQNNLARELV